MADFRRGRVAGIASPSPTATRHKKCTVDLAAISLHPSTVGIYGQIIRIDIVSVLMAVPLWLSKC